MFRFFTTVLVAFLDTNFLALLNRHPINDDILTWCDESVMTSGLLVILADGFPVIHVESVFAHESVCVL